MIPRFTRRVTTIIEVTRYGRPLMVSVVYDVTVSGESDYGSDLVSVRPVPVNARPVRLADRELDVAWFQCCAIVAAERVAGREQR